MSDAKIRLRAFLGCEEAREICGGVFVTAQAKKGVWPEHMTPNEWRGMLHYLAAKLPPWRVEVEREEVGVSFNYDGSIRGPAYRYEVGNNTTPDRYRVVDVLAEQWLLVLAAAAVAKECWNHGTMTLPTEEELDRSIRIEQALAAIWAWLEEPTREREKAWTTSVRKAIDDWARPDWLPYRPIAEGFLGLEQALQAAAEILGEPRVRELVSAALLEVL